MSASQVIGVALVVFQSKTLKVSILSLTKKTKYAINFREVMGTIFFINRRSFYLNEHPG